MKMIARGHEMTDRYDQVNCQKTTGVQLWPKVGAMARECQGRAMLPLLSWQSTSAT